jgi:hypothetical protein
MKADARPDSGGGPEREELREMLRHWQVPGAPPEIEEGLRQAFRGRRAPRRRVLWLSLAACVTLLVSWQLWPGAAPVRPAAGPGPVGAPATQPSPTQAVDGDQASGSTRVAVARARTRRPATPPRPEPEVIVEPAQAELLAQLGRELWATRQAAPGATIPQMPDVEVLLYRQERETVAGEWPLVQQSVPIGER